METEIESLHFEADSKLQDLLFKKTDGLSKIFDRIESCKIILKLDKNSKNKDKVVEVSLHVPHTHLFAKDQAESFEIATDMVVTELKKQLIKYKDKMNEHERLL